MNASACIGLRIRRKRRASSRIEMLTHERLKTRQRDMRRRMAARPRTGRPIGRRSQKDFSLHQLRFELFTLLNAGHKPSAAVHAVNKKYGTRLIADVVRKWRASAYTEALCFD